MHAFTLTFRRALVCAALFAMSSPATLRADVKTDRAAALKAIRTATAARNLVEMKKELEAAAKLRGEAKYDDELARLEELCDCVEQFWKAVDTGARSLRPVDELKIDGEVVVVVEFDGNRLVLRAQGQNRSYTLENVPMRLCLMLAAQAIKPDAPENKVIAGAFLLMDGKGDRKLARQLFDEAAKAKVDVANLLPEFNVPLK